MAGKGPAPKESLQSEAKTKAREADTVDLVPDTELRGPDLPEFDWHPRTVAWWMTWRRSAQAKNFVPTDWDVLLETALLHTRLWNGEASMAGEIRLRVAKWGATYEDRKRLKINVDAELAEAAASRPAVMPTNRRRRLMRIVDASA